MNQNIFSIYTQSQKKPPAFASGFETNQSKTMFCQQTYNKPTALLVLFYIVIAPGIDGRGSTLELFCSNLTL